MRAFAILTAAVFVAIGIGVALVSGLPNQLPVLRTYGSAPLRFEAAFPASVGRPKVQVPVNGLLIATACSGRDAVNVTGVDFLLLGNNWRRLFPVTGLPSATPRNRSVPQWTNIHRQKRLLDSYDRNSLPKFPIAAEAKAIPLLWRQVCCRGRR